MHKAPIVEERSKRKLKIGDIVRFDNSIDMRENGMTGIVTAFYHDGEDAMILLSDGRLFIDRTEFFTVL